MPACWWELELSLDGIFTFAALQSNSLVDLASLRKVLTRAGTSTKSISESGDLQSYFVFRRSCLW